MHQFGFDRINGQLPLDALAAHFGINRVLTKWWPGAVPKTLDRILFHSADDVLGVFARLVLAEQRDHLPHHYLSWIVPQLLRHRHQLDAMLRKLADVEFEAKGIAAFSVDTHAPLFARSF